MERKIIVLSFCIFDRESYLTLAASLIGATSLIFNAHGNICVYIMAEKSLSLQ